MRVILIDANNQKIFAMNIKDDLPSLQALVGGHIEAAMGLPQGHVLYVDEDGLYKPQRWFFRMGDYERPFAGNGVIVGPEKYDRHGDYVGTADATIVPKDGVVRFMSRHEVDAWAKATASEPESYITDLDTGETEVIAYRGQLWGDMPRPESDDKNNSNK